MRFWMALSMMGLSASAYAESVAGNQNFDLGIESMRSHGYSVGIFVFMMIAIAVFLAIVFAFSRSNKGVGMKRGEKVLVGLIVFGVFVAIIFAALQLLDGFLF